MKTSVTLSLEDLAELGEQASTAADAQARRAGIRVAGLERPFSYPLDEKRSPKVTIFLASSVGDLFSVAALREFIAHELAHTAQTIGKVDFDASYLLAAADDTVIGSIAMRYFAEYARLESLMIVPEFRGMNLGRALIKNAVRLSRAKGYRRIYARTRTPYSALWRGTGFLPVDGTPVASGDPVEIVAQAHPFEVISENDLQEPFRFEEILDEADSRSGTK